MNWVFRRVDGQGLVLSNGDTASQSRKIRKKPKPPVPVAAASKQANPVPDRVEPQAANGEQASRTRTITLTSGLFRVPQQPNLTLNLYAINPGPAVQPVTFMVNLLTGGQGVSRKDSVFSRQLELPAGEAVQMPFTPPAGSILEVNVELVIADDRPLLVPSATLVQFFPADAGTIPHVTLPAGSFAVAQEPRGTVTTGLIDIPQGVAASRPQTEVLLSNLSDGNITTEITVFELVEHVPNTRIIEEHSVTVPPGSGAVVSLAEVEGRTVQINAGAPAGLAISLEAYTLFLADESTLPTFRLGPTDWLPVPRN